MKEVIIRYKENKTLDFLKAMSKFFDFKLVKKEELKIPAVKKKSKLDEMKGYVPGDRNVDVRGIEKIFSGRHLDAKSLREEAWTRRVR